MTEIFTTCWQDAITYLTLHNDKDTVFYMLIDSSQKEVRLDTHIAEFIGFEWQLGRPLHYKLSSYDKNQFLEEGSVTKGEVESHQTEI